MVWGARRAFALGLALALCVSVGRLVEAGRPISGKNDDWHPTETYSVEPEEGVSEEAAFLAMLEETGAGGDYVLLEFFAPWCGHCRKFRPFYERVAGYFNTARENLPWSASFDPALPRVLAFRCDCTTKGNTICNKFGVKSYPTLYFGTKADYRAVLAADEVPEADGEQKKAREAALERLDSSGDEDGGKLHVHDESRIVEYVEELVARRWNQEGQGDEPPPTLGAFLPDEWEAESREAKEREPRDKSSSVAGAGADAAEALGFDAMLHDMELSTGLSLQFIMQSPNFGQREAREDFINWQSWIAHYHPSSACAQGASDILNNLHTLWPDSGDSGSGSEALLAGSVANNFAEVKQCGESVDINEETNSYLVCKEYSCGLWMSFHAMSVQEPSSAKGENGFEPFSGQEMVRSLHSFIDKFFMCDVCRTHFLQVLAGEQGPGTGGVATQRDFALWLWEAHNIVNLRLGREEKELGQEDPSRLKVVYPERERCPSCYAASASSDNGAGAGAEGDGEGGGGESFNRDDVLLFLTAHYTAPGRLEKQETQVAGGEGREEQNGSWRGSALAGGDMAAALRTQQAGAVAVADSSSVGWVVPAGVVVAAVGAYFAKARKKGSRYRL
mmetsp:Transcript_3497/g.7877  ORF Transcript_3497/g.7877 Transcript_3497/m.7877 type:complete len:618 (-) Transcript_3497:102-1955(-)